MAASAIHLYEPSGRVRRPGAGRKPATVKDPRLRADLEALVEPTTRGDPESPLRWTCKSLRRLAEALQQQGHQVSRTLVAELLNTVGYSLPTVVCQEPAMSEQQKKVDVSRCGTRTAVGVDAEAGCRDIEPAKSRAELMVGGLFAGGSKIRTRGPTPMASLASASF